MSQRAQRIRFQKQRARSAGKMARQLNRLARQCGEPTGWIAHHDLNVCMHTRLGIFMTEPELKRMQTKAEKHIRWKMGHSREERRQFDIDAQGHARAIAKARDAKAAMENMRSG